jgi:hypothetical protein
VRRRELPSDQRVHYRKRWLRDRSRVTESLSRRFHHSVEAIVTEVKGKTGEAARFVLENIANGAHEVPFCDVKKHINVHNAANFKKNVRTHPGFRDALAEEDIIECPEVLPNPFMQAFDACFGVIGREREKEKQSEGSLASCPRPAQVQCA